jgi:vitamin K-dependent gamma-carboxylase
MSESQAGALSTKVSGDLPTARPSQRATVEPPAEQRANGIPGYRAREPNGHAAGNRSFIHRLFDPVDNSSLAFFRIAFGAIMCWEVWRYFSNGWIARYYITPSFHFSFYGFEWIRPWPGNGMYLHFLALGVLAVCITLGLWYRLAAALFFVGFSYVFLLEAARYLNHLYLAALISLLMIFIPAHRALSIDAWRRPDVRSNWAPAWSLWLLRAQIGIPYFYGAVAKLNEDWLRGEPLRTWFARRSDWQVVGPLFTQEWVVYLFSYGGLLLDLLIVPLLLFRRTRVLALAAAVAFNLMNAYLFRIGIFPWFMIAATLLFFDPGWPRRLVHSARARLGSGDDLRRDHIKHQRPAPSTRGALRPAHTFTLVLLGCYLAVQLLMPLRHYLYPGNVLWTEEGFQFSWRMKLREKSGTAELFATDPETNTTWQIDPAHYLTRWQINEMVIEPDLVLQFAHHVARDLRGRGHEHVEIRARVMASLNGRRQQPLIDPAVDLAAQPRNMLPAGWIMPLTEQPSQRSARRG